MKRQKKEDRRGNWVFVPSDNLTPEQAKVIEDDDREDCLHELASMPALGGNPFGRIDEFHNYFPDNNKVPKDGCWILVKKWPCTEYTVPPMSIWFATPWPMQNVRREPNRAKIVTPRGDLGLFPCEYGRIENPEKYFEFIGEGISVKFFTKLKEDALPKDKLFYLRSRGIAKKDALTMLIGQIRSHGVLWMETKKEIAMAFSRDWPRDERLATIQTL